MAVALNRISPLFKSRTIKVGDLNLGGSEPIVIQSMTTTDTMNIDATVAEVRALVDVGCQVVRITAPTVQDAEALKEIKSRLVAMGIHVPLVADIHFVPAAAMVAADYVEKVRINPGNFADRKMFKVRDYSEKEYAEELERIHEKFKPLVLKLKSLGRALRIGTNHGSLSDRILNRFGDTPEGMIQSAFEFAEICRLYDFHNFCFSMKASNVGVMIEAYRLLVQRQMEKGWDYPIHLGVTEAGDGEDGRIKSAIGIGTLLSEGIGDTIRVSLTEASVKEIPFAQLLSDFFAKNSWTPRQSIKRESSFAGSPMVWTRVRNFSEFFSDLQKTSLRPDGLILDLDHDEELFELHTLPLRLKALWGGEKIPILLANQDSALLRAAEHQKKLNSIVSGWVSQKRDMQAAYQFVSSNDLDLLSEKSDVSKIILSAQTQSSGSRGLVEASYQLGTPLISQSFGGVLLDGLSTDESLSLSFGILQATRRRISKTEYISCPSCGRTLFDLESTTARIKSVTSHLKGVKIAIMGCIVNGPGEMADADFGYVGGAPGRVNLYVGKDCVERNIPSDEAPTRLIDLIKKNGRWTEPK